MFGWFSAAAFFASRRNRSMNWSSFAWRSLRILMATRRPSSWSSARKTSAMPPAPSLRTIMYRPSKSVSMRELPVATSVLSLETGSAMQEVFEHGFGDRRRVGSAEAVRLLLDDDRDGDLRIARRRERGE